MLKQHDVIVIGAGLSGLAAAHALKSSGLDCLVLEARNRIGGRIHTIHSANMPLDLGAHWLHKIDNNPLADIVRKNNLTTQPTTFCSTRPFDIFNSMMIFDEQGVLLSQKRIEIALRQITQFTEHLEQNAPLWMKDMSIAEALHNYAAKHALNADSLLLAKYISTDYGEFETGANAKDIAAKTVEIKPTAVGSDVMFSHGCSPLLEIFSKDTQIILNQPVTDIYYDQQGVNIKTCDNDYSAKYVIVTLPLGVLKSACVTFHPMLPPEKLRAICNMGYGVLNKIFLRFDEIFWDREKEWILLLPEDNHDVLEIQNEFITTSQPLLVVYTTGAFAREMEHWNDKQIIHYLLKRLRTAFGNTVPAPLDYVITRWGSDPFSCGSFSYTHVGNTIADYQTLSQPIQNRVFFAGEATAWYDSSTLNGAYFTGVKAAAEITSLFREKAMA